jgi:predicted SAM-dependent methyltransferase
VQPPTGTARELKLNIGCGDNPKSGWINIDLLSPRGDLALDMREPLPFADNSVAIVYSEHFFEHLDYPGDAQRFLKECRRVLKPGGVFSVGVPDTQWPLEAYTGPDERGYFPLAKAEWHPGWCKTRLAQINYHFRQDGEHRFAYDLETLSHVLSEAGFISIKSREFDSALDDETRRTGTLYMNAAKPG